MPIAEARARPFIEAAPSSPTRQKNMAHRTHLLLAGSLLLTIACSSAEQRDSLAGKDLPPVPAPLPPLAGTAYEAAGVVPLPSVGPEDHPSLHNLFALGPSIVSGSEPHDEEAFRILHEKGIRTILSVDGKVPDEELAVKYGMKYVHVPIQYRGITEDEVAKIAKTFREQEGPFYVHCFHGKHRGPAAAEIGRLVLDGVSRETALAEMRQYCGTAQSYEGLYRTIAYAKIPSADATESMEWDFPAASPLDGIAGAMVLVSRADDHLKDLAKRAWQPDAEHPDVDAVNEASKLMDVFTRALVLDETAEKPADFHQWMQDSKAQAAALRDALSALKAGTGTAASADQAYKTLSKTCTACHDAYRNN
jgi:protein tyrosine phosphatase (PTP) superfamily phosphohydrolase (DUF442 family)